MFYLKYHIPYPHPKNSNENIICGFDKFPLFYPVLKISIVPLNDASISFIRIIAKNQIPYLLITMGLNYSHMNIWYAQRTRFLSPKALVIIKIFSLSWGGLWLTLERFANCRKEPVMDSSHGTRPRRSQSVRRRTIDDTLSGLSYFYFLSSEICDRSWKSFWRRDG